ncbi:MAG: 30S ribosomal protein S17 [archaeon]|nr:30S ribosomal protein S17 [archaeon]
MKKMAQEVLGIKAPQKPEQYDKNCPFYGELVVKKETIVGTIIKKDTNRSATIEWKRSRFVPKYERYEVKRFTLRVHNPTSVNAQVGQKVIVARTRPLSKTKNHVILGVVGGEGSLIDEQSDKSTKKSTKKTSVKRNKETKDDIPADTE